MSNSSLVNCTVLSPNHSGKRTHKIDRITPHCVVGQLSAESIGGCFTSTSRQASCNYGIGKDGRVCLIVDEANRSWCSSSSANDQRAITIECASDKSEPYAMNSAVYNKLVDLCIDICKRNGIKKLLWFADKNKSLNYSPTSGEAVLTVHRWFANKSCPGDWLYGRLGDVASKVTAALGGGTASQPSAGTGSSGVLYRVQTGAFSKKENATALEVKVKAAGFSTYITQVDGLYKVQVGAFSNKANADAQAAKLKAAGFECFVTTNGDSAAAPATIKQGSLVKVKPGAKTYTGGSVASFVYMGAHTVDELVGDRAVLGKNSICTPFNVKDLILA